MVRSSWWIHVQNSLETMPVASTPPATPRSEFGDGTSDEMGAGASNPMAFSTCGSLMEIISPTAEDHILDCALLFQRIKDDGQLVLLTDSVTLKIKTMAEVYCNSCLRLNLSVWTSNLQDLIFFGNGCRDCYVRHQQSSERAS